MSPWSAPLQVSVFCWCALEMSLVLRDVVRRKTRLGRDRGTRLIVSLAVGGSIVVGLVMRTRVGALDMPAPQVFAVAGVIVIWIGLAVRVCC